ncbi:hypothetical protein LOD99_14816 [Oopsacas minuta]|uniref:General transcription factor 3C polypeptide 3 n=1 Tax=Oopsacas minuta TaxID=111878 RepID=A0AAV7KEJ6_9METZ|nr:hypothetical protein LOD99_14816 [Oopsacas minuta]
MSDNSEYEPDSNDDPSSEDQVSSPMQQSDTNIESSSVHKEMGMINVFGDTELSESESDDSQLEGGSSYSDDEDTNDPEWLPLENKKEDKVASKHSKIDSEFERFRKMEFELFQEQSCVPSPVDDYDTIINESHPWSEDANDSDIDEDLGAGEIAEQAAIFFSQLHQTTKSQRKILKGFEGNFINRKAQRLPTHLEPVMGSANIAIAKKKYTDAIDLCNEVIRQAPCCSAPYINLALIYKELEDMDRYFQFTLLALHINSFDRSYPRPEDADSWEQLGLIAKSRGDLSMANECIKKSLYAVPKRPEAMWLLAEIRLELKDYRQALAIYSKLEKIVLDTATPLELSEIARRKALILYESGNIVAAREIIYQRFCRGWEMQDIIELFNLLLELHFIEKEYTIAFKTAVILFCMPKHSKSVQESVVVDEFDQQDDNIVTSEEQQSKKQESKLQLFYKEFWSDIPPEIDTEGGFLVVIEDNQTLIPIDSFTTLPLDLRAKLIMPSVYTNNLELAYHLITHALRSLPITEYGDIWLDVSEALLESRQFDLSVDLLRTVLECEMYNLPGVWLMLARSIEEVSYQNELGGDWDNKPILDEAIGWYRKVIDTIPDNVESRLRLAGVYEKKGMREEAIGLLERSQDGTDNFLSTKDCINLKQPPDVRVVYKRTLLHLENGQREQCLEGFLILLDYFFREVYLLKSFQLMVIPFLNVGSRQFQNYGKTEVIYSRYQPEEEQQDKHLTLAQWYGVLKNTCKMLCEVGKRDELFRLIIAVNILKKFHETEYVLDVQMLSVSVCIRQRSFYYAYRFARPLMQLIGKSNVFAMLFNCLTENNYLARNMSLKVIRRIWFDDPSNYRVALNFALILHSIGSFHLSLLLLHTAYKLNPENARLLFFMGMAYIRLAHNRSYTHKNAFISQAFALIFKYKEKMGDCAEVLYNVGRAFHAIGYKLWACDYYHKVIALDNTGNVKQYYGDKMAELSSLRREAAFNLSLVYEESGSRELARVMLQTYCVI